MHGPQGTPGQPAACVWPGAVWPLFPESALNNDSSSGFNRAKLAWYNIEPVLQEKGNNNNPLRNDLNELSKPETRQVYQREIFPRKGLQLGEGLLTTFDMAYYPKDRGPYNFEARNTRINGNGKLINPTMFLMK